MFKKPKIIEQPAAVVHTSTIQKIHFNAKQAFGAGADETLLWSTVIPISNSVRKRMIVFKNVEYVISNWAQDQYPLVIYITADGINGYLDKQMQNTERLAALELTNVDALIDTSGIRTYQLRYALRDSSFWQMPLTLTELNIRLKVDEQVQNVSLPLPNPLTVNIQIRAE